MDLKTGSNFAISRRGDGSSMLTESIILTEQSMAGHTIPHFHNDAGHTTIEVGTKEFMCVGANPPFDHPHEFLDMGDDTEIVCPYCSTHYKYNPLLSVTKTHPENCLFTAAVL